MCGTNKPPFSRNILLINKFSDNPPGHVSGTVGSRDPRKTWPCPSWGPPCYRGRSSRLFWTVIARERMHFVSYVAWEWGQRLHWLWNQSIKIFVTETVFYLRQLRVHVIDDTLKICKIILLVQKVPRWSFFDQIKKGAEISWQQLSLLMKLIRLAFMYLKILNYCNLNKKFISVIM